MYHSKTPGHSNVKYTYTILTSDLGKTIVRFANNSHRSDLLMVHVCYAYYDVLSLQNEAQSLRFL